MELFEAIFNRRSIKNFKPDNVPDEVLERALEAGTCAQNHRVTQPWRFVILGEKSHRALAENYAEVQVQKTQPSGAAQEQIRAKAVAKILSKPLLVSVSFRLSDDAETRKEDYAATCCAIQNIQLAAWAQGLGMQWSTSSALISPATYELLKINAAQEEIAGLLFFGYPAAVPAARTRKPLDEILRRVP